MNSGSIEHAGNADKDKGVTEAYEASEIQTKKSDLKLEISQHESTIEQAEKDRAEAIDKIAKVQEDIQKWTLDKEAIETELADAEKAKSKAEEETITAENEIKKLEIKIVGLDETIKNEGVNENKVGKTIKESLTNLENIRPGLWNAELTINTADVDKKKKEEEKEEEAKASKQIFVTYADCKNIAYSFPDGVPCPSGYYELWTINRLAPDSCCDALHLCEKPGLGSGECTIGYYVVGLDHSNMGKDGVIPKKMHGYIRVLANWGGVWINMRNEATGQTVQITGNHDIPYSITQDQTIRFTGGYGDGIVVLYVREKDNDDEATKAVQQESKKTIERLEAKIREIEVARQQAQENKRQVEAAIKEIEDKIASLRSSEQDITKRKKETEEIKVVTESIKNQKLEDKTRLLTTKESLTKTLEEKATTIKKLDYEITKAQYEKKYGTEDVRKLEGQIETLKIKKENLEERLKSANEELNKLRNNKGINEEL